MDILVDILFWIHLVSLGLGGAAVFGIPVVGSKMATATAETRPLLFSIANGLSTIGRTAIGLLIVTGPLLVWLKFGGVDGLSGWFWAKMALVVVLLGVVIYGGLNARKAQAGDRQAAMRAPQIGMAGIVVFVLVIGCAVMSFS